MHHSCRDIPSRSPEASLDTFQGCVLDSVDLLPRPYPFSHLPSSSSLPLCKAFGILACKGVNAGRVAAKDPSDWLSVNALVVLRCPKVSLCEGLDISTSSSEDVAYMFVVTAELLVVIVFYSFD